MSFILEALKKSERERQQGQPPDLFAVHGETPAFQAPPGRRPRLLLWAGLGTLIAALGGGYLWFGGGTTGDTPLSPTKTERAAPAKPPAAATRPAAEPAVAPAPAEKPIVLPTAKPAAESEGQFARQSAAPPASAAPAKGRITIRPEIPTLRFSGHTYSEERSRRMIMVNNRILREGDWIDGNIRLEEITWEGVILDHQGVQLKVKTQ